MRNPRKPTTPNLAPLTPQSSSDGAPAFSMEQQRQIDGLRTTLESLESRYNKQERFVKQLKSEVQTMRDAISTMGAPLRPTPLDRAVRVCR